MSQHPTIQETRTATDPGRDDEMSGKTGQRPIVIVGVDGSAAATAAAEWAAEQASRRDWSLVIVHVCETHDVDYRDGAGDSADPSDTCVAGHQLLGSAAAVAIAAAPEVAVATRLLHGKPEDALRSVAPEAAMVVIGAREGGQVRHTVLGTVTSALAADTSAPLTIVRASAPGTADGPVVVGVDLDGSSGAALDLAFAEADARNVDLVVVHSWRNSLAELVFPYAPPLMVDLDQLDRDAHEALDAELAGRKERYPDVAVQVQVTTQGSVPALLEAAAGAQLIVVGTRGRGAVSGLLLGSTSRAVLAHGPCPVAVVSPAATTVAPQ